MKMKALITTISLIFVTLVLTGCAGRNPYEQAQYQQPVATAYRAAPAAVPYSNTNLQFQPLQRSVPVQPQYQQQVQQTQFQQYLKNSTSIPQQAQYQQQQYQYAPQYQQQRVQLSPTQKCDDTAQRRILTAKADYQASTMYNNDGIFSGSTARVKYRQSIQSVQRSYTSCMQSARRKELVNQYEQQYQTQQYQQPQYQQTGYVRY
jgi:hypothetical protein